MKNQRGDHVAKQKRTKKDLENQVNELAQGLCSMYIENQKLGEFMIGLENLVMYLAEHLDKKDSFEDFLQAKVEEHKEKEKKEAKEEGENGVL